MSTPKWVLAASETLRHILELNSCQMRPGGNLCSKPVAERLEWPRWLQISQAVWLKMLVSYPRAEGEPCFGVKWQHMSFDCPPHVV